MDLETLHWPKTSSMTHICIILAQSAASLLDKKVQVKIESSFVVFCPTPHEAEEEVKNLLSASCTNKPAREPRTSSLRDLHVFVVQ